MENRIWGLETNLAEGRTQPAASGTDEILPEDVLALTEEAQQSGEEVHGVMKQFPNARTLAVWEAPAAPQTPEDRGQKFPDSPDVSGSDQTQLRGCGAQLRMLIHNKPTSLPDEQSKMWYTFTQLRGISLGQILPHIWDDGTIGLEDRPACIQLLEATNGDPDRVATAE